MNNKILLAVGAATLSITTYTAVVSAATVTADADANVVQALLITQTSGMNFGDISESGGGTITLNLDGTRTAGAGTDVLAGGANAQGVYNISGGDTKAYTLSYPVSAIVTGPGGATMTVNNFDDDADGTAATGLGEDFNLGADIVIAGGQTAGAYTGTYTITVEYN